MCVVRVQSRTNIYPFLQTIFEYDCVWSIYWISCDFILKTCEIQTPSNIFIVAIAQYLFSVFIATVNVLFHFAQSTRSFCFDPLNIFVSKIREYPFSIVTFFLSCCVSGVDIARVNFSLFFYAHSTCFVNFIGHTKWNVNAYEIVRLHIEHTHICMHKLN